MHSGTYLLATTSQSLLLIESRSCTAYCLDSGRHHYFGITRDLGHYYVGVRYRANTSPVPKAQERGKVLCFDRGACFVRELEAPFPLRDIHQILLHDGRLWVTCTFDNMVAVYDGEGWEEWYPLGAPEREPRDTHHFNSLTALGNQLCVVAHNLGAASGKASELLFFQLPDRRLVRSVTLGNQAHNAWLQDGELMTCSSGTGCLLSASGRRIDTGGFPRGIACIDDETHVGISEFAARPERDLGRGWIQVYDREWRRQRTLVIENEGMVTDLLGINAADAQRILEGASWPRRSLGVLYGD